MDQIFEPFYTTKEPGVGTGLGLSITRDIVSSLDGRIEVSSAPGQGSIFAVEFPVRLGAGEHLRDSGSYRTPPARRRSEDSAESGM
jgi:signal transduction histidine kinase